MTCATKAAQPGHEALQRCPQLRLGRQRQHLRTRVSGQRHVLRAARLRLPRLQLRRFCCEGLPWRTASPGEWCLKDKRERKANSVMNCPSCSCLASPTSEPLAHDRGDGQDPSRLQRPGTKSKPKATGMHTNSSPGPVPSRRATRSRRPSRNCNSWESLASPVLPPICQRCPCRDTCRMSRWKAPICCAVLAT